MQINLSFDNLTELKEFANWAASKRNIGELTVDITADTSKLQQLADTIARDMRGDTRPVTAEGAVIDEGPQDAQDPVSAGAGEPPSTDPAPEAKPKRKRRTRAEIAADEAAAKAAEIAANAADESDKAANPLGAPQDDGPTNVPAHVPEQSTASPEQLPELLALAATIDGANKLAHMNEGREFISKHGFPRYNETFALVDVPANIAAHTPEQGALHRAAMQWLAAQDGAK